MDSIRSLGVMYMPSISTDSASNISAVKPEVQNLPEAKGDEVSIRGFFGKSEPKPIPQIDTSETVKITVLPQDPAVASPKTIEMPKALIGDKIEGPKMYSIENQNPKAIPDLEGNYLYQLGTKEFDQVNCYATAYNTFNMMQDNIGHEINWAFREPKLGVNSHKREGMNAYYARHEASVNFFYFDAPPLGKTVQTSQSTEIVSHEVGHAILDAVKPGYMGWDTETMSVHEGFGDVTAMLFTLQDDDMIKKIIEENGGDMQKPSLLSKVGEEFGIAIAKMDKDPTNDDNDYLRTLLNDFKYVNPSTLPQHAPDNQLANEVHSFSRIFSAANYDVLSAFYDANVAKGMEPEAALKLAGKDFGGLLMKSIDNCPNHRCKYKDVALNMLKVDMQLNEGSHMKEMEKTFIDRGILTEGDVSKMKDKAKNMPNAHISLPMVLSKISSKISDILSKIGSKIGIGDGTQFQTENITDNMYGGQTIYLKTSEDMQLKGKEFGSFENCFVAVDGGISLAFDKDGKLVDYNYDKIDSQKKADVKSGILSAVQDGKIKSQNYRSLGDDDPTKFLGEVKANRASGKSYIERIPVIA